MPTQKARINLSMPEDMNKAVKKLARRDGTSLAAKALELIRHAIEFEEDAALLAVATKRQKGVRTSDYLSHEEVWG